MTDVLERLDLCRVLGAESPELKEDTAEGEIAARMIARELGAMTQPEIAALLGVSKQRVEQLESQGLRRLRGRVERE